MDQMLGKSQEFKKAAECLYPNLNKVFYARCKLNGKQIRRSLNTSELAIAKRRLEGEENRNIRFEELADEWLASIKSGLKPKSYDRRRVALVGLTPFFRGMAVKSNGFAEIDAWRRKRGATVSARSHNIELGCSLAAAALHCHRQRRSSCHTLPRTQRNLSPYSTRPGLERRVGLRCEMNGTQSQLPKP